MLQNTDSNTNGVFPPFNNHFPNNTSQIINYYINVTQNLNMNSHNVGLSSAILNFQDIKNPPVKDDISKKELEETTLLNSFINFGNFISLFQIKYNNQIYANYTKNIEKENKNKLKEEKNIIGKKRNKNEINIMLNSKKNKNIKYDIKQKNCNLSKSQNKENNKKINNSNEVININKEIKHKIKININPWKNISDENVINLNEQLENEKNKLKKATQSKEYQNKNINGKKKKKCKELLQDTFLENLDQSKKDFVIIIDNSRFEKSNKFKNTTLKKSESSKINMKKSNSIIKKGNNISKIHKNYKHHFTSQKRICPKRTKFQSTECIFHGDNYEKTSSAIDFMKYNFNFIEKIKPLKKIENEENQVVNLKIEKSIYKNNYENNKSYLSDIKLIWPIGKNEGNNTKLINKKKLKEGTDIINEGKFS